MAHLLKETGLVKQRLTGATFLGTVNAGVDDTGQDVKLFGATSGKYMLWDESADEVQVVGKVRVIKGSAFQTGLAAGWSME